MKRTYRNGDSVQITPHFKSSEFQCKCGKAHDFDVYSELVDKLEQLYSALNCSEIRISSGYRCVEHDKAVGGSGTGQHTLGKAADVCCYGQDGKPISSKNVCCAAADLGFSGVARINDSYTHIDVRTGHWFGDETKGNNYCIPCSDFYEYFGLQKTAQPLNRGIDISLYQDKIDWTALSVDFVIIKAGQKDYTDPLYEQHYAAAKMAGIPVGAYWYGEAQTVVEAQHEADCCIERLKEKQFEYPVYYDVEGAMLNLDGALLSAIVNAFCERVEKAGFWVGLYMSGCPMLDKITSDVRKRYALWVADTRGSQPDYISGYGMWQYSGSGTVSGVNGAVDLDYCYTDYPTQIKAKRLNGYGKLGDTSVVPDKPPDTMEVQILVDGKVYGGTLTSK